MKGDFTRATFRPENHYSGVFQQQGRVQLDADTNEQAAITQYRDEMAAFDIVGPEGAPIDDAGFEMIAKGASLLITPGRFYVDGILVENHAAAEISAGAQPDLPGVPLPVSPAGDGTYAAYLHVWQRHVTALDRDSLREVALGGPDTATRNQTVWQVRLERQTAPVTCTDFGPGWIPTGFTSTGRLRAQHEPAPLTTNECLVPASAGYRRLENQLYRVEIHMAGDTAAGTPPTYKWSRDNGTVVARLKNIQNDVLTLEAPARDSVLGFAADQWVELSDEGRVLRGEPGVLVELKSVQGTALTVKAWPNNVPLTLANFGSKPTVRRWDSSPGQINITTAAFAELEGGVQVQFAAGQYRTGDYWLIPARTLTGKVEWPVDNAGPIFEARHGTEQHFAVLAIVRLTNGVWTRDSDCRRLFPPLTDLVGITCAGGDGQVALPGASLPCRLTVAVRNGTRGVVGARVRFQIITNNGGGLRIGAGAFTAAVTAVSSAQGLTDCEWQLPTVPPVNPDGTRACLRVRAMLLNAAQQQIGVPVFFGAFVSVASEVAYDPAACPDLTAANARTVQAAIDALCRRPTGGGCEVTVGEGGRFPTIEEAVTALVDQGRTEICLCLLPGQHNVRALRIEGRPISLCIRGCGSQTRVFLQQSIEATLINSICLKQLSLNGAGAGTATARRVLFFTQVREVTIDECCITQEKAANDSILVEIGEAERISITGSLIRSIAQNPTTPPQLATQIFQGANFPFAAIFNLTDPSAYSQAVYNASATVVATDVATRRTQAANLDAVRQKFAPNMPVDPRRHYENFAALLRDPAPTRAAAVIALRPIGQTNFVNVPLQALAITDGGATTLIRDNRIDGNLTFYGVGSSTLNVDLARLIIAKVRDGRMVFRPSTKSLCLENNVITNVDIPQALLARLVAQEATELRGIYRQIQTDGNEFITRQHLLAETHTLSRNFYRSAGNLELSATGRQGSYLANRGIDPDTTYADLTLSTNNILLTESLTIFKP